MIERTKTRPKVNFWPLTSPIDSQFIRLRFLVIVLLLLGIFFRVVNIDKKVYWHDEAYTSLRIAGYTQVELIKEVFDGHIIDVKDLQNYQQPNSQKSLTDTIKSLAKEDSQHPPLYFLLARFWMQLFGNSATVTRSLSIPIGLLVFPLVYWLCLELFQSPLTAWVAVALFSISPLHVLYAQEAREYVLWTVAILFSSWALLQAIKKETKLAWAIYAVSLAIALYTFLFSILVAVGHGVYVIAIVGFRFTKTARNYLLASIAGFITLVPWILVIITNFSQIKKTTASAQQHLPIQALVSKWNNSLVNVFIDFWRATDYYPESHLPNLNVGKYLIAFILILVGYSLYFIYCSSNKRVWLFVFTLIGSTGLCLILSDLMIGGKLSSRTRYLIPCYIGIQIAIAYVVAKQIFSGISLQRKIWKVIAVILISGGVFSCAISSQAETWWNKGSHDNPQVARIINQAANPLVISTNNALNPGDLLSLSHLLAPKVRLQLFLEPRIPTISSEFSDRFLFNVSKKVEVELAKKYTLKLLHAKGNLWKIENK